MSINDMDIEELYEYDIAEEFCNTYFYNPPARFALNKGRNLRKQLLGVEFLNFLRQKAFQSELLYNYLYNVKILEETDFGKILELNSGPEECLACNLTASKNFDITVVSKYASKALFLDYPFEYFNGELKTMQIEGSQETNGDGLYLKYNEVKDKLKRLSEFDTIINVNPKDPRSIFQTYLYAVNRNKFVVTGYITSLYDLNYLNKIETVDRYMKELEQLLGYKIKGLEEYTQLTRVKVFSNLN